MDGLHGEGPLGTELANRLRELAVEGEALPDVLRMIAREGAGTAKSWTRESLLRQLRDRMALKVAPSYVSDMGRLEDFSRAALTDVSDEVAGVRVDRPGVESRVREQMARHRLVNLSGLPGSGKSAALKRAAETLATGGPLLFLKYDRIENHSWAAFAEALGIEHGDPVKVLAEIGSSGTPTLFVDGIDRIDPAQQGVVLDIVRAIDSSEHLDHWTVLATSRNQGLEGYRTWFPESFYRETGLGDVTVPPFDDVEAAQLAQALPALSPLLLGSGNVADVARRPFFAAVLARSGATQEATPQTEIDLVGAWWRGGGYDGRQVSVVQRQRALLDVAEQGLRTLGRRVPARVLREATLNQVGGLVDDGLLKSIEDGVWYSFAHDIFFEWVFIRRLLEMEEDWTDELIRTGEPPLLGRVVGLLAQKALEVADGWIDGYRRLESMDLRPQWRREWLTAPPLISAFAGRHAEFARYLAEDGHRLLGKFLLWFQAHHTTPNPQGPGQRDRTRRSGPRPFRRSPGLAVGHRRLGPPSRVADSGGTELPQAIRAGHCPGVLRMAERVRKIGEPALDRHRRPLQPLAGGTGGRLVRAARPTDAQDGLVGSGFERSGPRDEPSPDHRAVGVDVSGTNARPLRTGSAIGGHAPEHLRRADGVRIVGRRCLSRDAGRRGQGRTDGGVA